MRGARFWRCRSQPQSASEAESIVESPATVDGRPVTPFIATFAAAGIVEMYFTPSGIPVLTKATVQYTGETPHRQASSADAIQTNHTEESDPG